MASNLGHLSLELGAVVGGRVVGERAAGLGTVGNGLVRFSRSRCGSNKERSSPLGGEFSKKDIEMLPVHVGT